MKTVINTPKGPRTLPEWAKCHCVSRHTPVYIHPLPFALPSGEELWLCPNTFSQANTLLGLYTKLSGPPSADTLVQFSQFTRSLIRLYWNQLMKQTQDMESFNEWKERYERDKEDEAVFMATVQRIRRAEYL